MSLISDLTEKLPDTSLEWVSVIITVAVFMALLYNNMQKKRRIILLENTIVDTEKKACEARTIRKDFLAGISHQIRTSLNGVIGMTRLLRDSPLNAEQQGYANIIALSSNNLLEALNGGNDLACIENRTMTEKIPLINLCDSRILVITDSAADNHTIEQQLAEADVEIETANSLSEGLNLLLCASQNYVAYHTVIFDQMRNQTDYIEFGQQIKNNAELCDTALLLLSPNKARDNLTKTQNAGFDGYLRKPVGSSEIILSLAMIGANNTAKTIEKNNQTPLPIPFVTRRLLREKRNSIKVIQKATQNFHGLQILLVEDNLVSRMIAKRTLNLFGCIISIAENGLEAITLITEKSFDIIFMDCQMPRIDGYETTQKIITHEKKHQLAHTPIIALTANVMKGDAEKCLAAGMDDYIAKPIQSNIMVDVILRWLGPLLIQRAQQEADKAKNQSVSFLDLTALDRLKSMTGDDFIPILESYITAAQKGIPSINDAITARDAVTLRRECHSLKSSSQQIGAPQLGDLAAQLEERGLSENFEDIQALFKLFSCLYEQVESHLNAYIKTVYL